MCIEKQVGLSCEFNGHKATFLDDNHILFDGEKTEVEALKGYTYRMLKKKIKANGGACGLFQFLNRIAEDGKKEKCPLFFGTFGLIAERYCKKGGVGNNGE